MFALGKISSAGISVTAMLCALANPAIAQDADPESQNDGKLIEENDAGIGVIVVTAQKREQNIQDVPVAISAVSSEFLEARDVSAIDDLGSIAPNVKIERAPGSATTAQISIRGSVTINPAITFEPAVGIYLDGVYIAKNQGAIFDIADLERVEVLRGPQGTLYGRNTLAGAVNLITAKPTGKFEGSAEITYGAFDYQRAKATVNLPAVGPFSAKISGQIARRDGYFDIIPNPVAAAAPFARPNAVDEAADLDSHSVMAQLRFEPSDRLLFDYSYDYSEYDQRPLPGQLIGLNLDGGPGDIFDADSDNFIGIPLASFVDRERSDTLSLDADIFERTRTYGHALTATLDLGALELKSITAYRDLKFEDRLDLDGSPISIATTTRLTDMDSFSQELQLTGAVWDDRVNFVLGGFYYDESAGTENPQLFFGVFGPFATSFDSRYASKTTAYAAYAQADVEIATGLTLTLGARYTEETKSISRFLQNLGDPDAQPIDIDFGDVDDAEYDDFSPAVTLAYEVNPDLNVYARYAKGYKSGGFNGETNVFVAPTADCPSGALELCDPYLPETVDSYEIGLKSVLADGAMVLNVAGFWDDHKDIQLSVFDASGAAVSKILNAASATIRGVEIEAVFQPTDAVTINTSFAYLNAEYDSFLENDVDVSDNRAFPHTPDFTAAVGADWRVFDNNWGQLNLIGDLNMVSEYFTFPYQLRPTDPAAQVAGNSQSPGRVILNLRANLSKIAVGGTEAKLSAWMRNVTNEDNPSNFIDFGPGFGGILLGYYPDPRTYGLTLGMAF